jgi:hypothetical protein
VSFEESRILLNVSVAYTKTISSNMCELYDIIDHFGSSIAMPRAIISGGSSVDPSSLLAKKINYTIPNIIKITTIVKNKSVKVENYKHRKDKEYRQV